MFDIRVLPTSQRGPDGERLGRITIGDFTERFACHDAAVPVDGFTSVWRDELRSLVQGRNAVALVHDPRFCWVVYRDGEQCFVQQLLMIDGCVDPFPPRQTVSDTGERISEWPISLHAIAEFLSAQQPR
jgi:hypothetical protein